MSPPCPVCNSFRATPTLRRGTTYFSCPDCRLVWRQAPPELDEMDSFYLGANPETAINSAKRRLFDHQLNASVNRGVSSGRILDIGCSTGAYLTVARSKGWSVYGVEPVKPLADVATRLGIPVWNGVLETMPDSDPFDLITYWDVIMMVRHPLEEIAEAKRRLSENGTIYIRVRRFGAQKVTAAVWKFVQPFLKMKDPSVFHPYNFQPQTLRALAHRLGFDIEMHNGRLTSGDAYAFAKSRSVVVWLKAFMGFTIGIVERLTRGRWLISPTIDVWLTHPDHTMPRR